MLISKVRDKFMKFEVNSIDGQFCDNVRFFAYRLF